MNIPICPYCGKLSLKYNKNNTGYIYECEPCDARIGCHDGTDIPFGTLANGTLRSLRIRAHEAFDEIWRTGRLQRKQAYNWLSQKLGIPYDECHIGLFRDDTCLKVIELSHEKMGSIFDS